MNRAPIIAANRAWAVARALMGAFVGLSLCWIGWCLFTSGDFFAARDPIAMLVMVGATVGGAYVGFKARSRFLRIALPVVAVASLVFWVAAPNGWWAASPPRPSDAITR